MEPQVLEEIQMFHASRSIDEAKRSASQLQSSSLAAGSSASEAESGDDFDSASSQ